MGTKRAFHVSSPFLFPARPCFSHASLALRRGASAVRLDSALFRDALRDLKPSSLF
jgi:hypothetical protein